MKRIRFVDQTSSEIELTQERWALVSNEDLPVLQAHSWSLHRTRGKLYAKAEIKGVTVYMHRVVMRVPKGSRILVDYRNSNGLDNRRSNLRLATVRQNAWNSAGAFGRRASSGRGVAVREHPALPFRAYLYNAEGRFRHLGYFSSEAEAIASRREAAAALHGEFLWLEGPF